VLVGKAVGEGQSHDQIMALGHALQRFALIVGGVIAVVALVLIPLLFVPFVFPLFKLFGSAASIATVLAVANFATIPVQAYAISAITGTLRCGGDVFCSTVLDISPQWLVALPMLALFALVLDTGIWPIAIAMQMEGIIKLPLAMLRIRSGKWIRDVTRSPSKGGKTS
jgi:Na+-driven multidrug efflux pump